MAKSSRANSRETVAGWILNSRAASAAVLSPFETILLSPEDEARLSAFGHEHLNMLGRYSFTVSEAVARGEMRPLRTATES